MGAHKKTMTLREGVENVWRDPSLLYRAMAPRAMSLSESEAVWLLATALVRSRGFAADFFLAYEPAARDGRDDALGEGATEHAWPQLQAILEDVRNRSRADEHIGRRGLNFGVATELSVFERDTDWDAMPEDARRLGRIDLTLAIKQDVPGSKGLAAQLVIEAKRGSAVDKIQVWEDYPELPQPVLYAALWDLAEPTDEADIRVMGTIGLAESDKADRMKHEFVEWWKAQREPTGKAPHVSMSTNLSWDAVVALMKLHPDVSDIAELIPPASEDS